MASRDPTTRQRDGHRLLAALVLALAATLGAGPAAHAQDAPGLKARHEALRDKLANNPFQRPLVLESAQSSNDLKGEVYAIVDQPFAVVAPALTTPEQWCDLLMLHLNVKNCSSVGKPPGATTLTLAAGRKFDQPLEDTYKVEFVYTVPASTPDYLRVQMSAENGPLSTKDYRLALEAVPLDEKRSFLHMSYSYAYGTAARFAMQAYLATAGSDKVGFSTSGKDADGKPAYIGGVRGVVERNTMRYYLAIEAYLNSLRSPPGEAPEKRLRDWFAATERYPAQLHEMERDEYLTMKRKELARQKAGAPR